MFTIDGLIEFDCEGCGDHVRLFGSSAVPKHQMCGVCAWLCEHLTGDEFWQAHLRHRDIGKLT